MRSSENEAQYQTEKLLLSGLGLSLVQDIAQVARVVHLEREAFCGEGEDVFTLAMVARIGWILTTEDESGKITGAVEALPMKDPKEIFIHGVCVSDDCRARGIGSNLVEGLMKVLEQTRGAEKFYATVSPSNGPSLNVLLNKCGFSGFSFNRFYYGPDNPRFEVVRDRSWKTVNEEGLIVGEKDFDSIERLVNGQGYRAVQVLRSPSGSQNNLVLKR